MFDFVKELNKIAKLSNAKPAQTHAEREAERLKQWQRDYYLKGLERQKNEHRKSHSK